LRYFAARKNSARFYAGLAYEYEFDGDANATAYGMALDTPSLEGGTAVGEIGFTYQKTGSPFSADFNLSGFAGERDGISGRVDLNWKM
jgi:hypothetical protein